MYNFNLVIGKRSSFFVFVIVSCYHV